MTQFGYHSRSNSKFFPPTRPIVKAHIPSVKDLRDREREQAEEQERQRLEANRIARAERRRKEEERKAALEAARARRRAKLEEIEARLAQSRISSVHEVLEIAARETGCSVAGFLGHGRRGYLSKARQYAYWLCRERTGLSLEHIGCAIGGKDHSTISYGVKMHQARLDAGETMPWEE